MRERAANERHQGRGGRVACTLQTARRAWFVPSVGPKKWPGRSARMKGDNGWTGRRGALVRRVDREASTSREVIHSTSRKSARGRPLVRLSRSLPSVSFHLFLSLSLPLRPMAELFKLYSQINGDWPDVVRPRLPVRPPPLFLALNSDRLNIPIRYETCFA